jgi:hypothetical protein
MSDISKKTIVMSLYSCIIGILNIVGGAARGGNFYTIDNYAVRIIGLIFVIGGAGLLLRQPWARKVLLLSYCLSIVEVIVIANYVHSWWGLLSSTFALAILFFVIPFLILYNRRTWD